MNIYLDYAASGPIKKEVLAEMMPYLTDNYGNASSMHEWGRAARVVIDQARSKVAEFLNAEESEIIFTSGGTESDNMAINGLIAQITKSKFLISNQIQNPKFQNWKPHIITSMIEHHAILNTSKVLEKNGVEVTFLKPNADGIVEVEAVRKAIKENTVLVSIMYVNNEIGTIQPIREIGKMIEKINQFRMQNAELNKINSKIMNSELSNSKIYFHTDAVQAAEYQIMDIKYLHVDLLTLSGHKIGAPKGIGVLYAKKGVPLMPMIHGGEQEFGKRAGTENVAGIAAIGKAVEIICQTTENGKRIANLRNYFIERVLKEIPEAELNGTLELRSPNNANFYFKYIEGESILMNLDLVGIAASSGSACTSLSLQPSHVIMAVYSEAERAHGSIRFTLGSVTSKKELDYTVNHLKQIVAKLRKMSPLAPKEYK